jgi:hypothetical protein
MRKRIARSSSQKRNNVQGELKMENNHQHRLPDDRLVSVQGSMDWRPLALPFILLTSVRHSMPLCTSLIYAEPELLMTPNQRLTHVQKDVTPADSLSKIKKI